jgi:hypothetical protein
MKGSIRVLLGLLLVWGAVGGLDAGNSLLGCMGIAVLGLALMADGVMAMSKKN